MINNLDQYQIIIAVLVLLTVFYAAIFKIRRNLKEKGKGGGEEGKHHQKKKPCKCGGWLVEKTAKHGMHYGEKFLGCTNYPKCTRMERI